MFYILLFLAVAAFYYYFKTYGKEDFLGRASRGAKGFGKGFMQGVMEERMDEREDHLWHRRQRF